jgi:hypothetical protein
MGMTPSATLSATAIATARWALDGHLVEHHGIRLGYQVRRHHRKQRGEAVLVVGQRIAESRFHGAAARPDQQVDVGDFVALPDQRLAHAYMIYLRHLDPPSS